jgi:hypothetical protein
MKMAIGNGLRVRTTSSGVVDMRRRQRALRAVHCAPMH